MYVADLHIHSKYSRATSRDCDIPHLDYWARLKGVGLLGTGDFTHPAWRKELEQTLEEAGDGVFRLRAEQRIARPGFDSTEPRFVLSGEISTIYKKDGKTRKVHHVILLPSLTAAEELSRRLELIGNLHSDGRPILGLDSRDLLEITMESCPEAIFIPAHIWTPHFSLFGAFSQFSTVEECYGDMTKYIHAMETGLSSDPPMNRLLSQLDGYHLVSNSDAHSPARIAREANLLDGDIDYPSLKRALETGGGLLGTIEFYPEEGKYHLDGHRACQCRLEPMETNRLNGRCPVCGRKITVGVQHRVDELADRIQAEGSVLKPFENLMPLPELLADCLGVSASSKKVSLLYEKALTELGPELYILREASPERIAEVCGPLSGEAIRRLRGGQVHREAGYDGEYGKITLFAPDEREEWLGQLSFLDGVALTEKKRPTAASTMPEDVRPEAPVPAGENPEQLLAIQCPDRAVAVIAGPGTGKTYTLTERIAHLIGDEGVDPAEITAVTFTHQAAAELKSRLERRLGKKAVRGLTVGTFHSVCLRLLPEKPLAGHVQALDVMDEALREAGASLAPAEALRRVSAFRNGVEGIDLPDGLAALYGQKLAEAGLRDLDGVLLEALELDISDEPRFRHLLVDEFQDSNALQRRLVAHWVSGGGSLFVIGDADQSIYGFRGASAACFDQLRELLPDLRTITLTKNYRCTPEILRCAKAAIAKNPGGERPLEAMRGSGAPVRLVAAPDALSEGDWIAREIARLAGGVDMNSAGGAVETRCAFSDMAVLCRTRRQLTQIERCLAREGIPCAVNGRDDSLTEPAARGMAALLAYLLNPDDAPAAVLAMKHLFSVPEADRQTPDRDNPRQKRFWDACDVLRPRVSKEKPRKLLADAEQLSGVRCEALRDAALFFSSAAELVNALESGEEADLKRFTGNYASGAVNLMTLHGAKGLEFPVVFLAGVNKGDLPLERPGQTVDLREERRLLFVGVTRARDELILSHSGDASSFLQELPAGIVRETARQSKPKIVYEQLSLF